MLLFFIRRKLSLVSLYSKLMRMTNINLCLFASVYGPRKMCFRASVGYEFYQIALRLSMAELSFKDIMGFVNWHAIYKNLTYINYYLIEKWLSPKHMAYQFQPLTNPKNVSTLIFNTSKVQTFRIKSKFFVMPKHVNSKNIVFAMLK